MPTLESAAPQLLVDNLEKALAWYEECLGFGCDFVYEGFYAGISRDDATIHLKGAPKLEAERAHRKAEEHLDAYMAVAGVRELHDELQRRGANITKPLGERPWGVVDFYVEDPNGYILCFAEAPDRA